MRKHPDTASKQKSEKDGIHRHHETKIQRERERERERERREAGRDEG